jgi:hypothetical protein
MVRNKVKAVVMVEHMPVAPDNETGKEADSKVGINFLSMSMKSMTYQRIGVSLICRRMKILRKLLISSS